MQEQELRLPNHRPIRMFQTKRLFLGGGMPGPACFGVAVECFRGSERALANLPLGSSLGVMQDAGGRRLLPRS